MYDKPQRSRRPNYDTQWLYDEQWEPITSFKSRSGNEPMVKREKAKGMVYTSSQRMRYNRRVIGSQMNS